MVKPASSSGKSYPHQISKPSSKTPSIALTPKKAIENQLKKMVSKRPKLKNLKNLPATIGGYPIPASVRNKMF